MGTAGYDQERETHFVGNIRVWEATQIHETMKGVQNGHRNTTS